MRLKLNWGQSIAIVLFLFVVFIGSFVYKTLFISEYDHALISKEYYKEEIYFQKEIDRLENASTLEENVLVSTSSEGIQFKFPNSMDFKTIKAQVKLIRNDKKELDIIKDLKLDSLSYLIPNADLLKGRYILKLIWENNGTSYQYNEKIDY